MERRVSTGLTGAQGRKFGLTVGTAFLILTGLLLWRGRTTPGTVMGSLGTILVLAAFVMPKALGPVERAWMRMALIVSKVTTPVLMGIVYFLVVAPIGLVMRIVRGNPMEHRAIDGGYWVSREGETETTDMTRMF